MKIEHEIKQCHDTEQSLLNNVVECYQQSMGACRTVDTIEIFDSQQHNSVVTVVLRRTLS